MSTHQRRIAAILRAARAGTPWVASGIPIDLRVYRDPYRLRLITRLWCTPRGGHMLRSRRQRLASLQRFYHDPTFRRLTRAWVASGLSPALLPTLDHIRPLARGGRHTVANFQWLTPADNFSKGTASMAQWRRRARALRSAR